ncbi:MAG: asparaginase [Bacteroidetes bacterium]|nr:asparaginase [Bacteroidota bacterium]MBU2584917.1 asparaginase [Bacteroidota bacterium]
MKKVVIIFTGGTISMRIDEKTGGAVPYLSGKEIINLIPGINQLADIEIYDFGKYPGPHMTLELMMNLKNIVNSIITREDVEGIIITHGTDTLEETAYLLDLTTNSTKPIVVTGAMRNASEPNWDGERNLVDSIDVVLNENCHNLGVLVCLNSEINAASEVTKIFSDEVDTFKSLDFGALGFVGGGKIVLNRIPRRREYISSDRIEGNIDLILVHADMSEKFFKFSADSGIKGVVVEALGVGNVPPKAFDGIKYIREKNIPVVLTSRCPAGETMDIYGYYGAGKWLKEIGVIFSDHLNGQKAKIKLGLLSGLEKREEEIKKWFEE